MHEFSPLPQSIVTSFFCTGGAVAMRDLRPEAAVHASERFTGRHLIQTPFDEFGADAADPSVMTERDAVKLAKRAEKEEKVQRAAFAAHQVPSQTVINTTLWIRNV